MKVLMLNGGGLESLALAMLLKQYNHEVTSLHIFCDYPSAERMKTAAQLIATTYCDSHVDINLTGLSPIGWNESMQRFQPIQYQQLIFSSIGSSYCQTHGIEQIVSGFRSKFLGLGFKPAFHAVLNEVKIGGINPLELLHPLATISNDVELYEIIKNSPILHDTVSCLSEPACGVCIKCTTRATYNI